jgi:hypothetical protein
MSLGLTVASVVLAVLAVVAVLGYLIDRSGENGETP